MPVFALVVAVVGAVADPLSLGDVVLCAIPVAAFGLWVWVPVFRWCWWRWRSWSRWWWCSVRAVMSR